MKSHVNRHVFLPRSFKPVLYANWRHVINRSALLHSYHHEQLPNAPSLALFVAPGKLFNIYIYISVHILMCQNMQSHDQVTVTVITHSFDNLKRVQLRQLCCLLYHTRLRRKMWRWVLIISNITWFGKHLTCAGCHRKELSFSWSAWAATHRQGIRHYWAFY